MPGYKEIGYHIIFNVKMDVHFTRKSRLVANGHETEYVPNWDTYSSVVSRDSVQLAFLYAALNDLDIFHATYLTLILKHSVVRNYVLWQVRNLVVWLVNLCKLIKHCMDSNLRVTLDIRLYLQLYET